MQYKQTIQNKNIYEQRITKIKTYQIQKTNPIYKNPKTITHKNYKKPVNNKTHKTIKNLHETLNKFKKQPNNNPRTYKYNKYYEKFTSKKNHLQHIQKYYD